MNTTNSQEAETINRMPEMIEAIMSLHRCEDCPIRCRAIKKPIRSLLASIAGIRPGGQAGKFT